ncbi:YfhO family protein [Solitalea koreensis]|uniref:Membrane protein YfhO n=1 Tax=Solitalea koreensis TaxID=543615 RepID=A0A521CMP1_9SPHI|nr:YfhO family protein [Solitalea koreensis]SMO60645.1 membrane protein YfhO [Solitalea koreensis]
MNQWLKKNLPHVVAVALFIIICFVYFSPILQGKKLFQGDVQNASAVQTEIMAYKKIDGKGPLWTNSQFSGMPSFQIWTQYPANIASHVINVWNNIFPNPVNFVLLYLLGGYFLFSMLRFKPWLAFIGALAIAFSSYNFVIIEAGHTTKAIAIAFFAPILGGIIMAFRGRAYLGAAITAFFFALEIRANHPQMTYYLMIAVLVLAIVEFVNAFKTKQLNSFIKPALALLVAAIVGIGVNFSTLWVNYEYAQESTRGKSDLTTGQTGNVSKGLAKEYAYQWSEGIGESITFLVPDAFGGANGIPLTKKSNVYQELLKNNAGPQQAEQFADQIGRMGRYWGDKPFTSGPYYFGAIVVFLFILGLSLVKGPLKWWLAIATALSIVLAWGKNLQWFSDLFFDYFPMYSKFRAVESILVIAGIAIPLLAFVLLKQIFDGEIKKEEILNKLKHTVYGLGGFLLIFIAVPSLLLSFKSPNDSALVDQLTQLGGADFSHKIIQALIMDRISIARIDAIRSFIFILLSAGVIWAFVTDKIKAQYAYIALGLFLIVDMWGVDKRYLKDENFVKKSELAQNQQPREVDLDIMKDKDPYYRVYDMTSGNPFSNPSASIFHKSIGGYHAAKLKRYQNLIDSQIVRGNIAVLSMLNTKYIISPDSTGRGAFVQQNPHAMGNAWFVPGVQFVPNANAELEALTNFDPKDKIIVNEDFKSKINIMGIDSDPKASIKLTNYHPDHLSYEYNSAASQLTVFSDIYYNKGWNAYVDGKPADYFRANYVLRAMQLPAGKHIVEFKFEPKAYYTGEKISMVFSILLIGGLAALAWFEYKKKKEPDAQKLQKV